jgi:hypothetical protein
MAETTSATENQPHVEKDVLAAGRATCYKVWRNFAFHNFDSVCLKYLGALSFFLSLYGALGLIDIHGHNF